MSLPAFPELMNLSFKVIGPMAAFFLIWQLVLIIKDKKHRFGPEG